VTYNPVGPLILYSREMVIYAIWPLWYGVFKTSVVCVAALSLGWASFSRLQARVVEFF
jgi:ABC-type polysaccharide/polyol phosphate export permease